MILTICPAAHLGEVLASCRPSHALTMASPGREVPPVGADLPHLHLAFHDIDGERPPLKAPAHADVAALLAFGRGWTGAAPLLVSCELGISRSTAAGFALACQAVPDMAEAALAAALREAAPWATPNPLLIALADDALGRGGRMIEAVRAIGRGADYRPYRSFDLVLRPSPCVPSRAML